MEDFEQQLQEVYFAVDRYVKFRIGMADAEDLVQEICLAAYRSYGQLKDGNAFKSWIFSIARNKCNDFFRKSGAIQTVSIEEVPETQLILGRQGLTLQSAVADTMEDLSLQDRKILDLYFWQELSQQDIARRLDVPLGTIKSRLHHAKNRFRDRYPYPPKESKGEKNMSKMPKMMPDYTIEALNQEPFECRWEEMQGWLIVPRLGENLNWGMYDFPEKTCTSWCKMAVVGKAEVHGIEGVEITAVQYGTGDERDPGFEDSMERRFVAQLTDTHSRYLAETHWENGVRKCYTFLDGDPFLNNWGFGENNCGNEVKLVRKGLLHRQDDAISAPAKGEVLDVVGSYAVTINGKRYDTVCVMDVELYNEAVVSEQYIDRNGRTVLWRRFNRDDWAIDRFGGGKWSERLPENERITINGETYVHWYDCISDYIL